MRAFYCKVAEVIKSHLMAKQGELLKRLNPILRGWAQYHHPVVAKETFSKLDALIYWRLVRWAKRRHPKKSSMWVRQRYWHASAERTDFAEAVKAENGERQLTRLYRLADTAIVRHIKVKGAYNPFDSAYELYGEDLRSKRLLRSMAYRKEWMSLYLAQSGECLICKTAIEEDRGWHDHHIVYKVMGGSDRLVNRVLLHPDCHRKLHVLGLKVVKPVSK